jgi:uncharacterized protein involved in exopolysaccharide biosynthesis
MLDRQTFTDRELDEESGLDITPAYIWELIKRRSVYFAVPFLTLFVIGSFVALKWPAEYLSSGKILIQSPEIPADLVRPTVVSLANERIQIIQQRIMTRDNLLAVAKKYNISAGWRTLLSGTEIVDFVRDRTVIVPVVAGLPNDSKKEAIAFTVGFEYENPLTAMKVANEFMTMILGEDAKSRNANASETTKFLQDNVLRLEAQLASLDSQVAAVKANSPGSMTNITGSDAAKELANLKAQLLIKRAVFSDSHPVIRTLKRQIEMLEKGEISSADATEKTQAAAADSVIVDPTKPKSLSLDAIETKRVSVKKELDESSQKLAAARLGENLERGQHSERLEVIEQATLPTKSTKPNRLKLFAFAVALSLMAGGAAAAGSEFFDKSIRRSSDLGSIVDSRMIVAIPYIATRKETRNRRRSRLLKLGTAGALAAGAIAFAYFYVPDPEILLDKALKALLG